MVGHGGGGGSEAAAMSPATGGGGGKRGRGLEEDVYVDNLNSHKRYLSEVMASSMNGLSVGDSVADNTMCSPVRLENASCFRDETVMQYSPTSEESEDYRPCNTQVNTSGNQTDKTSSPSSSPTSSPNRSQKLNTWFCSGNPYPLPSCSLSAAAAANVRHTEHEGRIPSSPNDMCHGGDLRRTALLRSVQMRVQGPQSSVLLFSTELDGEQERAHIHADEHEHNKKNNLEGVELEKRSCPNSIQDARFGQHPECEENIVEECRPDYGATGAIFNSNDISSKLCVDVDERR